jgi:alkanesulfonate monooxygenase SsuD/methylene tetrahydromethanopterin reductase-like flavin-dependent oxidoreductase (luciferase family)
VPPLHLGLILPNYGDGLDAEHLARAAVAAEEANFDSGWVTDHVVVPPEHAPIYGTIAEALVSLGFLAGRTKRLQLGLSALVVPQRNPLVALKQLTTLDFLSGGRLIAAVAAGWMEGEFELLGADFQHRGRNLNRWLDLARDAFEQMPGPVRFDSGEGWLAPALVRRGGPELWVAGVSRATVRRAAKTGVWHPVALSPDELRPLAGELRERRPDGRVMLRLPAGRAGARNGRARPARDRRTARVDRGAPGRVPGGGLRRFRPQPGSPGAGSRGAGRPVRDGRPAAPPYSRLEAAHRLIPESVA